MISNSWRRHLTLGALEAESRGVIQTGPFGSQLHASDYSSVGTPVVMPTNIRDLRIVTDGIARVSDEHVERLTRHRLRAGDIVYSRRGDVEKCALVTDRQSGWLCGTGCLLVRVQGPTVDPRFLAYLLSLPVTRAWISQHAIGATMPNLNTGILREVPITLPPIDEQRGIATTLGALDDKIESNRRQIATANALADALWETLAIVSPTSHSMDELASAGTLQLSDGYRTRVDQLGQPGAPILRVADVADDHFAVRPDADHILDIYRPKYQEKMSRAGDVVVTTKGTVGRVALVSPDDIAAVYSPQICFIRGHDRVKLPPAALHRWVRSEGFRSQARQVQHQTDMAAYVSLADFRRFRVPVIRPDAVELVKIESLDLLIAARRQESTTLQAALDALLPELLSGRIRVSESAEAAEGLA